MVTGYVMRASKISDSTQTVYWAVVDSPDLNALLSDYDPSDLDLPASVDYTFETTVDGIAGAPSGFAGGDLAGQYPNPRVIRINGMDVSATIPTDKYVLSWNDLARKWEAKPQNAPEFLTPNRVVTSNSLGKLSADIPLTGTRFSAFMENPIGSMSFVKLTEDMIDPAFSINCSDIDLEVGQSISNPAFSVTYNRPNIVSAIVTDSSGAVVGVRNSSGTSVLNITGLSSFQISSTFSSSSLLSLTFNIVANDGYKIASKPIKINWMHKFYYGVGNDWSSFLTDPDKQNFIRGITPVLTTQKTRTITVDSSTDKYIYYAYPASYGDVVFSVNGIDGGFEKIAAYFDIPSAITSESVSYVIWKSVNPGLGNVEVSIR
jgi:hypothetical protein